MNKILDKIFLKTKVFRYKQLCITMINYLKHFPNNKIKVFHINCYKIKLLKHEFYRVLNEQLSYIFRVLF